MLLTVVDYGVGNLRSIAKSIEKANSDNNLNYTIKVSANANDVRKSDKIVLPGQGSFKACKNGIKNIEGLQDELDESVLIKKKPIYGICAGMQLFATKGYEEDLDAVINNALFPSESREMVVVKDIELYSMCEHHLLPFIGKCHVAYIPNGRVLGLSKVARIVDMFARRLQIQENLVNQVAQTIEKVTDASGVAVIIEAKHMCMMMRGVEKQNSSMKTSAMLGSFRTDQATRTEFLALLNNQ